MQYFGVTDEEPLNIHELMNGARLGNSVGKKQIDYESIILHGILPLVLLKNRRADRILIETSSHHDNVGALGNCNPIM